MATGSTIDVPRLIDLGGLGDLYRALVAQGYHVIGPAVRDGAIVLTELSSAEELPFGWGVRLEPGGYRLRRRDDMAAFGHVAGPQSWKRFLHPPRERLWSAARTGDGFKVSDDPGRSGVFIIAVNCTEPGETCFCASMGTGPGSAGEVFDLALTELLDDHGHRFLVDISSPDGAEVLAQVPSERRTTRPCGGPGRRWTPRRTGWAARWTLATCGT